MGSKFNLLILGEEPGLRTFRDSDEENVSV